MNRNQVVAALEANRDRAARAFAAPAADLAKTYAPGKWTVLQILAHLADCEFINLWRGWRAIAQPGAGVEVFEENDFASRLSYDKRPVEVSRDLFLGARNAMIHAVKTLPEDRLSGACNHPEKGAVEGWRWGMINVGHCEHHLGQIEAARAGKPWVRVVAKDDLLYGAKTNA